MSKKRMNGLKVVWLESFLAVIEHQTLEKAGHSLGCTHGTISRHIKYLDKWLGVNPFSQKTPYKLSDTGAEFEPVARQIVELLRPYGIREVWKPKVRKAKDPKL